MGFWIDFVHSGGRTAFPSSSLYTIICGMGIKSHAAFHGYVPHLHVPLLASLRGDTMTFLIACFPRSRMSAGRTWCFCDIDPDPFRLRRARGGPWEWLCPSRAPAEGGGSGWCRYFCYESRDCRYSSKGRCAGGNLCESELGEWESIIPKAAPGEDGGWCIVLSRPSSGVDTYDIYQICGH